MYRDTYIEQFIVLHLRQHGVHLTDDEVRRQLATLVRQVELTYQPVAISALKKYENENERNAQIKAYLSE